jgi:hypothetical protein
MQGPCQWLTPWLFSVFVLPLGFVVVEFNFTAMPLLLASGGRFSGPDRQHQRDH